MSLQPLAWSAPNSRIFNSITAKEGPDEWRISPVPRDVTRIHYQGVDPDGTIVCPLGDHPAFAESLEEAKIVIDILRAGTDHLPGWRDQLEAAGLFRAYPEIPDGESLSGLWRDDRMSGYFQITIYDGSCAQHPDQQIGVHCTYESGKANFWHNVSAVWQDNRKPRKYGDVTMRSGLPIGIDLLKAGVAAALAIRAARIARGGRFAIPLGGPTKAR